MLAHRLPRCDNIETALIQLLVVADVDVSLGLEMVITEMGFSCNPYHQMQSAEMNDVKFEEIYKDNCEGR